MKLLSTTQKNAVLESMINILDDQREQILEANKKDLDVFDTKDRALYDRLVVSNDKVDEMIKSIENVKAQDDPVGKDISNITLNTGLNVVNKTDPFGTIFIIYESRPDVTVEAAVLAFKANNKILLKGGKEASHSNQKLVECWHQALAQNKLSSDWITLLQINRSETQKYLSNPPQKIDLIVPRGGMRLIDFVKKYAKCAVLISGRGNNFLYVSQDADWSKSIAVIVNAKTDKISGCNALDKVLIDEGIPNFAQKVRELEQILSQLNVEILSANRVADILPEKEKITNKETWYEEFLSMKIVLASVPSLEEAIKIINTYSGKHSNTIMTESTANAAKFMEQIDSAAVYHNASTRFTDGGQMGVGAELAISTDKLHHRGPLGLKQLVTNKYYIYGDGHTRE